MLRFFKSELLIKREIGDHIGFLCAYSFCTGKDFRKERGGNAFTAVTRNRADRLYIGIVSILMKPEGAVRYRLAGGIHGGKA